MNPTEDRFWKPPPIEESIEVIKDKIRKSLENRGIPIDVQARVLDRFREADSGMSGDRPGPAPSSKSMLSADLPIWSHPFMKWSNQISRGHLPQEWEEAGIKLPSPRHSIDLRRTLRFSARLEQLASRAQRQLSEGNLRDQSPGSGEMEQVVKEALHLLLLVNFDDMLCGERQRETNALNARQQPQRLAGVLIFCRIMNKEGVERLRDVLYRLGNKPYQRIRVYKQQFLFRNLRAREMVELYKVTRTREKLLWSRRYQSSTFYEWRAEAWEMLQAKAEREAWEREQMARDEQC